jgi:hypothetical protein
MFLWQAVAIDKSLFKAENSDDVGGPVITISLSAIAADGTVTKQGGVIFVSKYICQSRSETSK